MRPDRHYHQGYRQCDGSYVAGSWAFRWLLELDSVIGEFPTSDCPETEQCRGLASKMEERLAKVPAELLAQLAGKVVVSGVSGNADDPAGLYPVSYGGAKAVELLAANQAFGAESGWYLAYLNRQAVLGLTA